MCSGLKLVLASGGAKNNDDTGSGASSPSSSSSTRRLFVVESNKGVIGALRLAEDEAADMSRRYDSSRAFLTDRPAMVRERTISKARKPTMSTVSSFAFKSR
jgi:hypothetical protein